MAKRLITTGQYIDVENPSISNGRVVRGKGVKPAAIDCSKAAKAAVVAVGKGAKPAAAVLGAKFVMSKVKRQAMFNNQIKRHPESMSKMINQAKLIKNLNPEDVRIIKICG